VDGGISNKASRIGRGSPFYRQESQMREPLLAGKPTSNKWTKIITDYQKKNKQKLLTKTYLLTSNIVLNINILR